MAFFPLESFHVVVEVNIYYTTFLNLLIRKLENMTAVS
jgi:hypothetical protein